MTEEIVSKARVLLAAEYKAERPEADWLLYLTAAADWDDLAALRAITRALSLSPTGEDVDFARTVLGELEERAPNYTIRSIERSYFDRAILAITGLLRRSLRTDPPRKGEG